MSLLPSFLFFFSFAPSRPEYINRIEEKELNLSVSEIHSSLFSPPSFLLSIPHLGSGGRGGVRTFGARPSKCSTFFLPSSSLITWWKGGVKWGIFLCCIPIPFLELFLFLFPLCRGEDGKITALTCPLGAMMFLFSLLFSLSFLPFSAAAEE